MAKKSTIKKPAPSKQELAKSAVKSAAAKRAAITKKLKKESEVILNDEKIKDLLDSIAQMTVDLDLVTHQRNLLELDISAYMLTNNDLRKEVENLRREKLHWESTCSDFQLELETQKAMFQNISKMADDATKQNENLTSMYSDSITINSSLRESLQNQQNEIENNKINFSRLQNAFDREKSILTAIQDKQNNVWYKRLYKWFDSGKSLGPRP